MQTYQVAVLLWADPNVTIAPLAKLAQLLDLWVRMLNVIFLRQTGGVVHPDVAAEAEKNACCLVCKETRI